MELFMYYVNSKEYKYYCFFVQWLLDILLECVFIQSLLHFKKQKKQM